MAHVMTRRGNLDNRVTYEHICDTLADLPNIPLSEISIGSTAIILKGDDGMEVYMADSSKEWVPLISGGGNDSGLTPSMEVHVCAVDEYNAVTGLPTIDAPQENTFYLVPNNGTGKNIFNEYVYIDDDWELFGSATIDLTGYALKTDIKDYDTLIPRFVTSTNATTSSALTGTIAATSLTNGQILVYLTAQPMTTEAATLQLTFSDNTQSIAYPIYLYDVEPMATDYPAKTAFSFVYNNNALYLLTAPAITA